MPTFGIVSTGFEPKTLADILADIQTVELQEISPSLDVQATALLGVVNGIVAQACDDLWQLGQALYNGMSPDNATGDQLASLSLLTGTARQNADNTQVLSCTVTLSAGFSALPGTMFAQVTGNDAAQFTNTETVTYAALSTGFAYPNFEAVDTGPVPCNAHTLEIAQPLTGWAAIDNPMPGELGSAIQNDADLRLARTSELATAGAATADAIRSDILTQLIVPFTTTNTTGCKVVVNDTDNDGGLSTAAPYYGVPPHSIEVIAQQNGATSVGTDPINDDQLLANLILSSKSAGIGTYGSYSKTAVDSQGNSQTIYFSRPVETPLSVALTVTKDPSLYPIGGDGAVSTAIVNFASETFNPGDDVYPIALAKAAFDVAGVLNISGVTVQGLSTVYTIDIRHNAVISAVTVTSVDP